MNIGLYNEPVNSNLSNYKGLYRQNNIIDLTESDNLNLRTAVDWFFSVSREGTFLAYGNENNARLSVLYSLLKSEEWRGEIILFTDRNNVNIPSGFVLLGYDICADSKYYSPIGDGFLQSYDVNNPFFAEMSFLDFNCYKKDLNGAGLFNTYATAIEFSKYCNTINGKYEHAIESENNWRPFAIYSITHGDGSAIDG